MTPITQTSDAEFEAEVRAMLARRSADVSSSPASRRHLTAAAAPAGAPGPAARRTVPRTVRLARPMLVAALVLVVCGAALAVRGTGPGADDDTTVAGAPDGPMAFPAPGAEGWDPATAPPVWPVVGEAALPDLAGDPHAHAGDLATPEGAAAAYLGEVASPLALEPSGLAVADDGRTAAIPWSFTDGGGEPFEPGARPFATGSVHLRDVAEAAGASGPLWAVVGATTDIVTIEDVRIEGGRLAFTTVVVPPADTSVSARVGVDGTFVATGGSPLPQGTEPPDPSSGELVHLADGRGGIEVAVVPGASVEILVRSVGGDFLSTTHMAIDVPVPAGPATAAPGETEDGDPDVGDPTADDPATGAAGAPAGDPLPTPTEPLDGTGVLALYAGRGSAIEVAQAYLDDRLPEPERVEGLVLDAERVTEGTITGGGAGAVIPWRIEDVVVSNDSPPASERYSGEVHLRTIEGGWAVVAATTDQIALGVVRRDGDAVTFTVDRLDEVAIDLLDLALFDLAGNPVGEPQTSPLGLPGSFRIELPPDVFPDQAVTLRASHVGGARFSLTEVRVPPAGAEAVSPP